MSSLLCFICHSTVSSDINDEIRDKYREVVGINLCPDSQLCYICCHLLNKLSLFKAVCLRRSIEYPVLFREKAAVNLQRSDLNVFVICDEDCDNGQIDTYHFTYNCDDCITDGYEKSNDHTSQYQIDGNDNEFDDVNDNFVDNEWMGNDIYETDLKVNSLKGNDNVDQNNDVQNEMIENVDTQKIRKSKVKKSKKKGLKKITLTVEEQKAELERKRKEKKYIEAEFKCYNCAMGFLFKDTYQAHMMRHEESNGQYSCPICTLRVSSLTLLRAHTTRHSERSVCVRCGVRVPGRHHVCKHARTKSLPCHMCARLFTDASGLQQHLKRVHISKTSGRLHTCTVCGETYNTQRALRTHMIKHIKRKFPCELCPSTYSSPYTLNQHIKTHTQVTESHYCDTCKVGFTTRKGLLAHKRNTMSHQQTLFECPICTRMCPNQRALASHIQTVHSTSKEYTCTICPARYTSRKSLVRHVGSHGNMTRSTDAVCHLCGNCFKGNNKLKRHIREVCEKAKLEELTNVYE